MFSLCAQEVNLLWVSWTTAKDPSLVREVPLCYLHSLLFFCLDFQLLCVLYFSEWSCFLSKIFHHLDTNSTLCISNLNFWNDKYVIIFQKKKKFLIWISATFSEMLPGSISVKILLGHTIIVSCISYCNSHFNGLLKPYSLDLKVPTKLQADHMLFAKELPLS